MDWWLASFFLGSIFSLFLPIVPDIFVLFLIILLSVILFIYKPLRLTSGLFFGASWMLCNAFSFQSLWQDNDLNAISLSKTPQWVIGKVTSLQSPPMLSGKVGNKPLRFNFNVIQLNSKKLNKKMKLRLSWNNAKITVQQGQTIKLKVKFKPAHGLANIGGFNYQTWLRSKRISATGYVINDPNNVVVITSKSKRQTLYNRYKNLLPEDNLSPLLLALGFGSRSEINPPLWDVLQATGTGHLIAISGLHIGLVATSSYLFLMLLIRFIPLSYCNHFRFYQSVNIRYFAIILSLLVGLIYGYLAGFSLPTIRALLMLSLYWLTRALNLHISIKRWLLLTLFLLIIMTPFSLITASFWLSVYAVIIIFLTLWRFKNLISSSNDLWRFVKGLIVIQVSLTLMLLPISAIFFQKISVVALLANVVAVPWMSFITIPLCLLSILIMPFFESLSFLLIEYCLKSLQLLWQYLNYLSQQQWSIVTLSSGEVQILVSLGVIVFCFLYLLPLVWSRDNLLFNLIKFKRSFLKISVITLLLITLNTDVVENKVKQNLGNKWQLIVFDVGQGLSVLIQQNGKAILYDTGATYPSGFTMVNAVILPYLQHTSIKQIDKMIISHSDNDHAGGLAEISKGITINELIYNKQQAVERSLCVQGKDFSWQNLHFSMLWPKEVVSEENNDSCVLLINDGKQSVLLTGDITKKVEASLLKQYPHLRADILIVPHHGSKTSSSDLFIKKLSPLVAVVSAGYLNRWNMPVDEVVQRYKQNNVELLNTAISGQIIFNMSVSGIKKQSYYDDLWPFWFAQ